MFINIDEQDYIEAQKLIDYEKKYFPNHMLDGKNLPEIIAPCYICSIISPFSDGIIENVVHSNSEYSLVNCPDCNILYYVENRKSFLCCEGCEKKRKNYVEKAFSSERLSKYKDLVDFSLVSNYHGIVSALKFFYTFNAHKKYNEDRTSFEFEPFNKRHCNKYGEQYKKDSVSFYDQIFNNQLFPKELMSKSEDEIIENVSNLLYESIKSNLSDPDIN